jgi:hypothetical protein
MSASPPNNSFSAGWAPGPDPAAAPDSVAAAWAAAPGATQPPGMRHAGAGVVSCPQCGAPVSLPDYTDLAICPFCGSTLERTHPLPAGAPAAVAAAARPGGQAAAFPAAGQVAEHVLHSLSCPQCAGPLCVRAGRRILLCSHCGVRVLVRGEGGLSRWLFPQAMDRVHALSTAAKWLAGYPGISPRARTVLPNQASLVHVPIWEHKALVAGWEFGTKLRTRSYLAGDGKSDEHLELAVVEERFEDPHLQERRFFQAACDLPALGATRPRFSGRELLLPLAAGEVDPASSVIQAQGAAEEVAEHGRRLALQPASGAADPQTQMLILHESTALLYYPLWLVDYHAGGQPYRVVVDGRDGSVNSATAPAKETRFTPALTAKVAALLLVAVLALCLAVTWAGGRVPSILLAVIVCVAAILLVAKTPAGGKVEYHEPFSS